jgi:hypothetical protein
MLGLAFGIDIHIALAVCFDTHNTSLPHLLLILAWIRVVLWFPTPRVLYPPVESPLVDTSGHHWPLVYVVRQWLVTNRRWSPVISVGLLRLSPLSAHLRHLCAPWPPPDSTEVHCNSLVSLCLFQIHLGARGYFIRLWAPGSALCCQRFMPLD